MSSNSNNKLIKVKIENNINQERKFDKHVSNKNQYSGFSKIGNDIISGNSNMNIKKGKSPNKNLQDSNNSNNNNNLSLNGKSVSSSGEILINKINLQKNNANINNYNYDITNQKERLENGGNFKKSESKKDIPHIENNLEKNGQFLNLRPINNSNSSSNNNSHLDNHTERNLGNFINQNENQFNNLKNMDNYQNNNNRININQPQKEVKETENNLTLIADDETLMKHLGIIELWLDLENVIIKFNYLTFMY